MIKRIATLTLLLLPFFCLSQSEELELTIQNSIFSDQIDRDIIDLIIEIDHRYKGRTHEEIKEKVELQEHRNSFYIDQISKSIKSRIIDPRKIKLSFLHSYFSLMQRNSANEIMDKLMPKPSFNDLLAIYLIANLSYHKRGMTYDGSKVTYEKNTINKEEFIIESIESLNSEEKLTQYYYSRILYNLKDKRLYNFNLENLGLNLKEQSFIYYRLVGQNSITLIELCAKDRKSKVKKLLNLIPNINGKHFTKFKPYIYEDEVKMELYNKIIQCYEAIQNE